MKKINEIKSKKYLVAALIAASAVAMLTGCGKKGAFTVDGPELDMDKVKEAIETGTYPEDEAVEEKAEEVEEVAEEEETVATPFLEDLEKYDKIISKLTKDQYYAFAGIGEDYDALLVTDGVYDNGDGNMAAIDAKVYGIGSNGRIYEAGSVWSDGTAYPIAVYENSIMFGGNHSMTMACVRDASVIIEREAYEEFDEQGNATYKYNEGDIDNIQTLEDDSVLKEMYDIYSKATVINFTPGEAEATGDMEEVYPSNDFEDRVGKTSFESYDEIIGLLEGDEAYALVDVKGYDGKVLLVADNTYDDLLGHIATTECTPYTVKSNGECTADSLLFTGGTATPVSLSKDGVFYTATHTSVEKSCYGENGTDDVAIIMMAYVYADELDDNGNAKSVSGFTRTKNSVIEDDSVFLEGNETEIFTKLVKEYEKTEPISFTKVSK